MRNYDHHYRQSANLTVLYGEMKKNFFGWWGEGWARDYNIS